MGINEKNFEAEDNTLMWVMEELNGWRIKCYVLHEWCGGDVIHHKYAKTSPPKICKGKINRLGIGEYAYRQKKITRNK